MMPAIVVNKRVAIISSMSENRHRSSIWLARVFHFCTNVATTAGFRRI